MSASWFVQQLHARLQDVCDSPAEADCRGEHVWAGEQACTTRSIWMRQAHARPQISVSPAGIQCRVMSTSGTESAVGLCSTLRR